MVVVLAVIVAPATRLATQRSLPIAVTARCCTGRRRQLLHTQHLKRGRNHHRRVVVRGEREHGAIRQLRLDHVSGVVGVVVCVRRSECQSACHGERCWPRGMSFLVAVLRGKNASMLERGEATPARLLVTARPLPDSASDVHAAPNHRPAPTARLDF